MHACVGQTSLTALSLFVAAAYGCADGPGTAGGIVAEIQEFEERLDERSWRACGVDTTDASFILHLPNGALTCQSRLGWTFNSCEREALAHFPDAARAHFAARERYFNAVVSCCEDGGPNQRNAGTPKMCTGAIVDACIDNLNATERPKSNGKSYGLESYPEDDDMITDDVSQCLEANGWSRETGMLPRTCGKIAVCPRQRLAQ